MCFIAKALGRASVLKDVSHDDILVALVVGSLAASAASGSGALHAWQHVSQHSSSQPCRYTRVSLLKSAALLLRLSLITDVGASMT